MNFDFSKYAGRYAMHCKTEEEANDFCKAMHEDNRMWYSCDSYINKNHWESNKDKTIYYFNEGSYGNIKHLNFNVKILEWSDFMNKQFELRDIQQGMLVEIRSGKTYLAMNDKDGILTLSNDGWLKLTSYKEDFTAKHGDNNYDIVKIYNISDNKSYLASTTGNLRNVLWERTEAKELTMQEIADKFGVNVNELKIKK